MIPGSQQNIYTEINKTADAADGKTVQITHRLRETLSVVQAKLSPKEGNIHSIYVDNMTGMPKCRIEN
jgi:hypothetical protein